MNFYRSVVAPILFRFDPEWIHHRAAESLEWAGKHSWALTALKSAYKCTPDKRLGQNLMGLDFSHPVGLAAGFDKDARMVQALLALGFSHVEVGTLTPEPQLGNEKPRLFRLPEDRALINRMGFNNRGVESAANQIPGRRSGVVGGNIGKNKTTANENAVQDYLKGIRALSPKVDYFALNVSSPNTPGLRALQDREPLSRLLDSVQELNHRLESKPILLKLAPDLTETALSEAAELVLQFGLNGVIASNTTIERTGLRTKLSEVEAMGAGGLSGAPLKRRSTEVVRSLRGMLGEQKVIVGVGGVFTATDVIEKLDAGADLVQVYTGFVYEGPGMIQKIVDELNHALSTGQWVWKSRFGSSKPTADLGFMQPNS